MLERRRHLVLKHPDAGLVADDLVAILDCADAADVEANRRIEFERVAAGRGFRGAEHHADLHADLVDEDHQRVGLLDVGRHLPQRLAHQARLQTDMGVAHVAFDFRLRRERGDGVYDDHIDGPGTHDHVADFERLLAGVRLRDEQVVRIDADRLRIDGIQGMLGVDERAGAAFALRLGDHLQGQRGLAGRFGPVDLDDAAPGQTADAQRGIESEGAGRHRWNRFLFAVAEPHHRTPAELPLYLRQRRFQGAIFFGSRHASKISAGIKVDQYCISEQ